MKQSQSWLKENKVDCQQETASKQLTYIPKSDVLLKHPTTANSFLCGSITTSHCSCHLNINIDCSNSWCCPFPWEDGRDGKLFPCLSVHVSRQLKTTQESCMTEELAWCVKNSGNWQYNTLYPIFWLHGASFGTIPLFLRPLFETKIAWKMSHWTESLFFWQPVIYKTNNPLQKYVTAGPVHGAKSEESGLTPNNIP